MGAACAVIIVTDWRDVDANGEPTGEWRQSRQKYDPNAPEPDDLTAAQIGEIFGAQLGSLSEGSNPSAQVLAGSALATVVGNIGGAISSFNSDDDDGDDPKLIANIEFGIGSRGPDRGAARVLALRRQG